MVDKYSEFYNITPLYPADCPNWKPAAAAFRHYPTAVTVLHQLPNLPNSKGIIFTAYIRITECYMNFIGLKYIQTLSETLGDFELFDPYVLNSWINQFKQNIGFLSLGHGGSEYFDQEEVECFWMSTHRKKTYLVRYEVIIPEWTPNGNLISPQYMPSCKANGMLCNLTAHTKLLTMNNEKSKPSCDYSFTQTIPGDLVVNTSNSLYPLPLYFVSSEMSFYISWSRNWGSHFVCLLRNIKNQNVYSTLEGLFVIFALHNGKTMLQHIKNETQQIKRKRDINFIKFNSTSTIQNANETDLSNVQLENIDVDIDYLKILEQLTKKEQPLDITNISYNNYHQINKRQAPTLMAQTPTKLHTWWLLEHTSWGLSEIQSSLYTLRNQTLEFKISQFKSHCENQKNFLLIGAVLFKINPQIYLNTFLQTSSYYYITTQGMISYTFGKPLTPNFLNKFEHYWCDGRLIFKYVNKFSCLYGSCYGILFPHNGIFLNISKPVCMSHEAPSNFLIPTKGSGSFDIISHRFMQYHFDSTFDYRKPLLFFPQFSFNVSSYNDVRIYEDSLSSVLMKSTSLINFDPHHVFTHIVTSTQSSWLTNYVLLPIITTIVPFIVILLILRFSCMLCCRLISQNPTKTFSLF